MIIEEANLSLSFVLFIQLQTIHGLLQTSCKKENYIDITYALLHKGYICDNNNGIKSFLKYSISQKHT